MTLRRIAKRALKTTPLSQSETPIIHDILKVVSTQKQLCEDFQGRVHATPGHMGYWNPELSDDMRSYIEPLLPFDLSCSMQDADDLSHPGDYIKDAETLMARAYGVNRSYFVTHGSSGAQHMIMHIYLRDGHSLLLAENVDLSIFRKLADLDLTPFVIPIPFDPKNPVPQNINAGILREYLSSTVLPLARKKAEEAGQGDHSKFMPVSLIVSQPSRFGAAILDLPDIVALCHEHGILVHVDETWGAHYHFHPDLPASGVDSKADYVVHSMSANIPAFNQNAVVHDNRVYRDEKQKNAFTFFFSQTRGNVVSTSFCFPFLMSLDYYRHLYVHQGREILQEILDTKKSAESVFETALAEHSPPLGLRLEKSKSLDPSKIFIRFENARQGWTPETLLETLKIQHGILLHSADPFHLTLLIPPGHQQAPLEKVLEKIVAIVALEPPPPASSFSKSDFLPFFSRNQPLQNPMTPYQALRRWFHSQKIYLKDLPLLRESGTRWMLAEELIVSCLFQKGIFLRGTLLDDFLRSLLQKIHEIPACQKSIHGLHWDEAEEPYLFLLEQKQKEGEWTLVESSREERYSFPTQEQPRNPTWEDQQEYSPLTQITLQALEAKKRSPLASVWSAPSASAGLPKRVLEEAVKNPDGPAGWMVEIQNAFLVDVNYKNYSEYRKALESSEDLLAKLVGVPACHFVTGGSTQANQIAMSTYLHHGDSLILTGNFHRSVAAMFEKWSVTPVYLQSKITARAGGFVDAGISANDILFSLRRLVKKTRKQYGDNYLSYLPKALLITAPTYYGSAIAELKKVIDFAHDQGLLVHVDEAWASHLPHHPRFPASAVTLGADIVVHSFHKTLNSLHQSSVIYSNPQNPRTAEHQQILLKTAVESARSQSPSKLLLSMLDEARKFAARHSLCRPDHGVFGEMLRIHEEARLLLKANFRATGVKALDFSSMHEDPFSPFLRTGFSQARKKKLFLQNPGMLALNFSQAKNAWNAMLVAQVIQNQGIILELVDPLNLLILIPVNALSDTDPRHDERKQLFGLLRQIIHLVQTPVFEYKKNPSKDPFFSKGQIQAFQEFKASYEKTRKDQILSRHKNQGKGQTGILNQDDPLFFMTLRQAISRKKTRFALAEKWMVYPPGTPGPFMPGVRLTKSLVRTFENISQYAHVHGVEYLKDENGDEEPHAWVYPI